MFWLATSFWWVRVCARYKGGYTAATIQIKRASGNRQPRETSSRKSLCRRSKLVRQRPTMRSLDAMVARAQPIEQVDAGNRGAESARQVASSVKSLVESFPTDSNPVGIAHEPWSSRLYSGKQKTRRFTGCFVQEDVSIQQRRDASPVKPSPKKNPEVFNPSNRLCIVPSPIPCAP